jgi:CTP synthase
LKDSLRVAIVGDYNPDFVSHPATGKAVELAAEALGIPAAFDWVPTPEATDERLASYDAIWASAGSPYKSLEGMLDSIRYARERGKPFVGT